MAAPLRFYCSSILNKSYSKINLTSSVNYNFTRSLLTTCRNRTRYPFLYRNSSGKEPLECCNIAPKPVWVDRPVIGQYACLSTNVRSRDTKRFRTWIASVLGGFIGLYVVYKSTNNSGLLKADGNGVSSANRLKYQPNRKIRSDADNTGLKLTLYQYQTCPFCTKVRAYLDYRGFSYDVVEVNSVRRNQIKWSKYKKVPILVCETPNNQDVLQLNDSSVIISALESFLLDRSQSIQQLVSYYPELQTENSRGKTVYEYPNKYFLMYGKEMSSSDTRKEEQTWRQWSDDVLVHALSPNIYLTPGQSLEAFKSFSVAGEWEKTFSFVERWFIIVVGATAMYFVGKILKKRHNLKDDVRESLYDACSSWSEAVKKRGTFLGGDEPNLADLAIYGELNAIEGCQTFRELKERYPHIASWYSATKKAIAARAGRRTQ